MENEIQRAMKEDKIKNGSDGIHTDISKVLDFYT